MSFFLLFTPVSEDLLQTGVQIRNMRNALKYIHGKKAKAINQKQRLSYMNRKTLTVRLLQASKVHSTVDDE